MLERIQLPNLRRTLFKIMGIPQPQSLSRLDRKLSEIEKNIMAWVKKVEGQPTTVGRSRRVLLADTETGSFEALREALPDDVELKMVKDWEQLFRQAKKADVPLVVIDLALLGQEGVQNIRKLKAHHPEIRVVALANYLSETLAEAMPDGMDLAGILQKPLDRSLLKDNLSKYVPQMN